MYEWEVIASACQWLPINVRPFWFDAGSGFQRVEIEDAAWIFTETIGPLEVPVWPKESQ